MVFPCHTMQPECDLSDVILYQILTGTKLLDKMKPARFKPYANHRTSITNFDRHCQSCGVLIKGAAHQKPMFCFQCKAPQDGRHGWMDNGWGRCADCDSWMFKDHLYCMCGWANQEAIDRKTRQQEALRQQEEHRKNMEIRELQKQLAQAERVKMQLQQRIDEQEANKTLDGLEDVDLQDD